LIFHQFGLQLVTSRATSADEREEPGGIRVDREQTTQHVLVIDDDASNVALYRAILEEEGYRVSAACSPVLEPQEITSAAPDLILLDLRLGTVTGGAELLVRLKADARTRGVPVLICSADHQQLTAMQDQRVDWDCGMLAKPFDLTDLLATIQACLAAGRRSATAAALAGPGAGAIK
jgi:CheY-like chemotaxis protein